MHAFITAIQAELPALLGARPSETAWEAEPRVTEVSLAAMCQCGLRPSRWGAVTGAALRSRIGSLRQVDSDGLRPAPLVVLIAFAVIPSLTRVRSIAKAPS